MNRYLESSRLPGESPSFERRRRSPKSAFDAADCHAFLQAPIPQANNTAQIKPRYANKSLAQSSHGVAYRAQMQYKKMKKIEIRNG
jgi:hypothetical protein